MRFLSILALIFLPVTLGAIAQPVPLLRAHAHNDYEHERPLMEALDRGFASVEADIYLVGDQLLVAHDLEDVEESRTLQALYLDPLKKIVENRNGVVYPDAPPLILLIDIKSEAEATYRVLREVLMSYESILTQFEGDTLIEGAVTVILSGNRPRAMLKAEPARLAAYDGRLDDLGTDNPESPAFIPLVSSNWNQIAPWYGSGDLDEEARKKLNHYVQLAHQEGRIIRFWATSNNPVVWETLYDAGVDLLNADDLEGLQTLILSKRKSR